MNPSKDRAAHGKMGGKESGYGSKVNKDYQNTTAKSSVFDIESQMLADMRRIGLVVNAIEFDTAGYVRVPLEGEVSSNKDGSYKVRPYFNPRLNAKNWVTGEEFTKEYVNGKSEPLTPAQYKARKQEDKEKRKLDNELREQKHAEAAQRAKSIYDAASLDYDRIYKHSYILKKGITEGIRYIKVTTKDEVFIKEDGGKITYPSGSLIIPVYKGSINCLELINLQFIFLDREGECKKFPIPGGEMAGGYIPIGKNENTPLLMCEGWATGQSLHNCLDYTVLVAFSAGNLSAIAKFARNICPVREIILCADNDTETSSGNTGIKEATKAAKAINGKIAIPYMEDGSKCDWNDINVKQGVEAVKEQFRPQPVEPEHEELQNTEATAEELKISDDNEPDIILTHSHRVSPNR
ncbi:MAG: toprim domain-containing protein [Deferribacteraceae bacterium]|jgi:putative DNA primase/helicase|nr:toprim domain-containing protein [Deferribacteraceae bacterium]